MQVNISANQKPKIYTEEQILKSDVKNINCIVYDHIKHLSPMDAIIADDFINNNDIEVGTFDLYNINDYACGMSQVLLKINKNLSFIWQYYGINSNDIQCLGVNDVFTTERELTPETIMLNTIHCILEDLHCDINVNNKNINSKNICLENLSNIMMQELQGNVNIKGLSIREWIKVIGNNKTNLIKFVISDKLSVF